MRDCVSSTHPPVTVLILKRTNGERRSGTIEYEIRGWSLGTFASARTLFVAISIASLALASVAALSPLGPVATSTRMVSVVRDAPVFLDRVTGFILTAVWAERRGASQPASSRVASNCRQTKLPTLARHNARLPQSAVNAKMIRGSSETIPLPHGGCALASAAKPCVSC